MLGDKDFLALCGGIELKEGLEAEEFADRRHSLLRDRLLFPPLPTLLARVYELRPYVFEEGSESLAARHLALFF